MLRGRCGALHGRTDASLKVVVIHGFAEIAVDAIPQGAIPHEVIRVCSDQDSRDPISCILEVSVEFRPGHSGHIDVGDQARRPVDERRRQVARCRREIDDGIAQQRYQPLHGFAKRIVILDDGDDFMIPDRHSVSRQFAGRQHSAPACSRHSLLWVATKQCRRL